MKSLRFDTIIVVDVESTCWKYLNPKQISEIIEIGVCPINVISKELLPEESIMVKAKTPISDFCTKLTSIKQEDIDKGISFSEACSILEKKYKTREHVWASYGNYDKNQFVKQCLRDKIRYPFTDIHINVKALFALAFSLNKSVGMTQALKFLQMPLEGEHHRGKYDAKNVAKILIKLLFKN